MADIRITPAASIMGFTSSLGYIENITQGASGALVMYGSGSTGRTNIFTVNGNQGTLFSVDDDLSGVIFSANTIAGLPVIQANANNSVFLGKYGAEPIVISGSDNSIQLSGSIKAITLPSTSDTVAVTYNTSTKTLGYNTLAGPSGTSGLSGASGLSGTSGLSGLSGTSGLSGLSGTSGLSGLSGTSGLSGLSGTSGLSGLSGTSGLSGLSGTSGLSGLSGTSGLSGLSGTSGLSGAAPTQVTVTAFSTNTTVYPTFVGTTSGANSVLVDTTLTYNAGIDRLELNKMWMWKGNNNTADSDNIMIGSGSGQNLSAWAPSTADRNTAVGYFAGQNLTTGRANMLFGAFAGNSITTGALNVFIGQQSGQLTNTNSFNCALGTLTFFAYSNANALYNTAIGYRAMQGSGGSAATNSANNNVVIGRDAGFSLTTGAYNTIIGSLAGDLITTGGGNTLIGSGSGESITTGTNNTLVGKYAGTTTLTATVALSDGLGNIQFSSTGSRANIPGSLSVGGISTSATVGRIDASNDIVAFSTSDIRFKENIQPIKNALQKVNQISGNTFDWKSDPELTILHGFKGKDVGVIAQEIEAILPEIVTTKDSGYKGVKYEKLVPLLIEAIKELTDKVNKLENK